MHGTRKLSSGKLSISGVFCAFGSCLVKKEGTEMNKGNVAAAAVGVVLFLFTCTENEPSPNNQQLSGLVHRSENVSVTTESVVKGHPSVTARPLKAAEAEGYRYSSGKCIYLKDSRGNSVNQYSLNGNLLKRYEIAGSEEIAEVCWADSSCLIYHVDNQRGEDTLWFVPIVQEEEKEILCLEEKKKIWEDIYGPCQIVCRKGDELIYLAGSRIYKRNIKTGREISLKKGFQYEDDLEIDQDFNLNPVYKDGRVLFTTCDAKYLLNVDTWETEKIWEQENGSPDQSANVLSTWNEGSIYFQVEDEQVDVYQYQLSTKKRKRYISGNMIRKKIEDMNLFPGQQVHYEDIRVFKSFAYDGRLYMDIFLKWKEEGIKESKADKAKLNYLKAALEDKRKEVKKQCLQPYENFEKNIKELVALIDAPIRAIDSQLKEIENANNNNTSPTAFYVKDNAYKVPAEKLLVSSRFNILVDYSFVQPANEAYQAVLKYAGASNIPDKIDTRIVQEVKEGNYTYKGSNGGMYGLIDTPADAEGWNEYVETRSSQQDTDGDGIPDEWEKMHNLNPNDPSDGAKYTLSPEYTNLEVYMNSLVNHLFPKK